ncbi:MAG: nuoJ [Phycisphaerales bacterium]|nr:nuoJ [Phycisphaerales bacterium]
MSAPVGRGHPPLRRDGPQGRCETVNMAGFLPAFISHSGLSLAAAPESLGSAPLQLENPLLILVLCVVAGVGTVLLLPARRDVAFRKVGGSLVVAALLIFTALLARSKFSIGMGIYFWIFAAVALGGAVRVITHPRPVYAALYFVLTVFASAGLFVLLDAEFMAAALVLIYAGAILITYVFVIMLASEARSPEATASHVADYDTTSREPIVAATVGFALMGVLLFVIFDRGHELTVPPQITTDNTEINNTQGATQKLGVYLFQHQSVNLELAGLLLTVSMVGAIVIARKKVLVVELPHGRPPVTVAPATPIDDNPYSIPVFGTDNPRQKAYPET